jgi:glutamate/tyrosine decarboxylase-like PLP-dependent enzyme
MSENNQGSITDSPFGDLHPYRSRTESYTCIPQKGRPEQEIIEELAKIAAQEDQKWMSGQVSGTMYHGGREHYDFLNRVFGLFSYVNLIQRDLCPSGTKFEAEITAMVAHMLHGDTAKAANPDDIVCGTVTSGGSESIYNAIFVYRERARALKGINDPVMLAPTSIHPAFNKAAHYLGVKLVQIPLTKDYQVDIELMRQHITDNTIALAGSAGSYPHGVIDPIGELSDLALAYDLGLHVDGCLGGFILPWIEKLGYPVTPFDFRNPGVTSMSCDTHKYGYSLKGTSVVVYRNPGLRRYQYFAQTDWPGGLYASPTVQGSRSGGLTAATWAAMLAMGEEGYLAAARAIMNTSDAIRAGINTIPEIKIMGRSTFLISMTSEVVDIYLVNDYLSMKGWRMNGCQNPPGFHFCITLSNTLPGVAEQFTEDLRAAVEFAKNPPYPQAKSGALYGLAGSLEGREFLKEGIFSLLDETYTP